MAAEFHIEKSIQAHMMTISAGDKEKCPSFS
jgi:hypothetical protein